MWQVVFFGLYMRFPLLFLSVALPALLAGAFATPADAYAQQRRVIKDSRGRVVRIVTTRNDGSQVVTDASGRVLEIIRTDNSGRTRVMDASGTVLGTVSPRDSVGGSYDRSESVDMEGWSR